MKFWIYFACCFVSFYSMLYSYFCFSRATKLPATKYWQRCDAFKGMTCILSIWATLSLANWRQHGFVYLCLICFFVLSAMRVYTSIVWTYRHVIQKLKAIPSIPKWHAIPFHFISLHHTSKTNLFNRRNKLSKSPMMTYEFCCRLLVSIILVSCSCNNRFIASANECGSQL